MRRLAATPDDSMAARVHVAAVVGDMCWALGHQPPATCLQQLEAQLEAIDGVTDRNRREVVLLLAWLLADPWFVAQPPELEAVLALLDEGAAELAAFTPARKFVVEEDQREELARFALGRLGLRPQGETVAQAQDRLTTLSAAERARLLRASRDAERRAQTIREALMRKAAQESADKWTRE